MAFIAISDDGNFVDDDNGRMIYIPDDEAPKMFAKSEHRCTQGRWFANLEYGRDPLVWELSQSPVDRISDITRICQKYTPVQSVTESGGVFVINL
jgi:hypothetical protein